MGLARHLVGERFAYDSEKFPFDRAALAVVNEALSKDGKIPIQALTRLHAAVDSRYLGRIYAALYAFLKGDTFMAAYRQYLKEAIAPRIAGDFFYQKTPGVRIHLPKTRTVQYHTDVWYGHGENVLNFWIPLTHSYGSNSIYVASLDDSIREVAALEHAKAEMGEINTRLANVCSPLDIDVGETYCFCARVVHGTEQNQTAETRVSLDYRLLLKDDDPGSKMISDYYESSESWGSTPPSEKVGPSAFAAASYLFPKHGFTKHVSAYQQRLLVTDFAEKNSISIVTEETEIKTMPHHPTLLALAGGSGTHRNDSVVLYSVMCLPEDLSDRQKIYKAARETATTLFFANEGLTFPGKHAEQDLERVRKSVL